MPYLIYNFDHYFGPQIQKNMSRLELLIRLAIEETGNASKLAKLVGVSRNVIRQWRVEKYKPTLEHLTQLAKIAKIPVEILPDLFPEIIGAA